MIGAGYSPGEMIDVFLVSSHYRYPLWLPRADTNGEFSVDMTFRSNIDMNGSRSVQVYSFQGHGTNIIVNIWYQTYNPTNNWYAIATGVSVQPSSYPGVSQVYVTSAIAPNNTYQFQTATNLAGAWAFIGFPTSSEDSYTSYADGFLMPEASQRFFRVANPYLPCPCDF
jgi:hypothetical protein